ncbi:MAG: nucleoside-diphosphate kinase [Anaerohalosphaera sp.]|nr:nucleoside-diphosphate kinase [Anaerohalosphaera sp.]
MSDRTLIIVKPDGVQRKFVGEIMSRFEKKGFKLVGAKFMQVTEDLASKHYAVHKGKPFFDGVVKYLASSPVMVMVWEADGIIPMARKMMGATFGFNAEPGTIRGDFSCSKGYNLIHGSDSPESAEYEIGLYFSNNELVDYSFADEDWLYGQND